MHLRTTEWGRGTAGGPYESDQPRSGGRVLVLFLSPLVAVTGARLLYLGDTNQAPDGYGGNDKEEAEAENEEGGATDHHTAGKVYEGREQQGSPEQEVK